jgi:anti-sigma factor ChrR (cupin superfamily)
MRFVHKESIIMQSGYGGEAEAGRSARDAGTRYLDPSTLAWVADGDKFWTKLLHEDAARGQRTLLMKMDAGAYFPSHAHEEYEQIYVVSGSFFDQDRVLRVGDYACRAPGAMHTAGTEEGALVLLIYSRP